MPWYRLRSGIPYHVTGEAPARSELIGDTLPTDSLPGEEPPAYPPEGAPAAAEVEEAPER